MVKMGFFFSDGLFIITAPTVETCVEIAREKGEFTGWYKL